MSALAVGLCALALAPVASARPRVEPLSFDNGVNGGTDDLARRPRARALYRRLSTPLDR